MDDMTRGRPSRLLNKYIYLLVSFHSLQHAPGPGFPSDPCQGCDDIEVFFFFKKNIYIHIY